MSTYGMPVAIYTDGIAPYWLVRPRARKAIRTTAKTDYTLHTLIKCSPITSFNNLTFPPIIRHTLILFSQLYIAIINSLRNKTEFLTRVNT